MFTLAKTFSAASLCIAMLLASTSSQAALVGYDFSGSIDSGVLIGESYFGHFDFDNTTLSNLGNESLNLSALSFNFLSSTFSLAHADVTATADFLNGALLGISYSVSSFEPAFAMVAATGSGVPSDVAYFAYHTVSGDSGYGSFNLAAVPLPGAVWLFGSSLALLGAIRRR